MQHTSQYLQRDSRAVRPVPGRGDGHVQAVRSLRVQERGDRPLPLQEQVRGLDCRYIDNKDI